jgi:hypothetical protein
MIKNRIDRINILDVEGFYFYGMVGHCNINLTNLGFPSIEMLNKFE